ncbi:MAG: AMP nucleosidase [Halobacteriovoraceae bacterium]|nr:AMP nucleosidase [Halobacteriovoraceae bacterium]
MALATKKSSKKKTVKKSTKKKVVKKTAKATSKKVKKTTGPSSVRESAKKELAQDKHIHPRRLLELSRRVHGNKAKHKIAIDMLERYTGHDIKDFQKQIILTNFHKYIETFNETFSDSYHTKGSAFQASTSKKAHVTIIEFGVGSAMAALIGELVSVINPKAVLFLGLCGAVHRSLKVGDFILPIASIRAEGVSGHFLPPQVPALPTFKVQKFVSQILVEKGIDYRTGTIHSTDFRFWEFDQKFKDNLIDERVLAVEMETAALFTICFVSKVNIGALLLVSDCPMQKGGIKTKESAKQVFKNYTAKHIDLGIQAMKEIAIRGEKIRHYTW